MTDLRVHACVRTAVYTSPYCPCEYMHMYIRTNMLSVHVHCRYSYTIATSWPALVTYYEVRHAIAITHSSPKPLCLIHSVPTTPAALVCRLLLLILLLILLSTPTLCIGTGGFPCNILCIVSICSKYTRSSELSSVGEGMYVHL